ncbi:MAG: InlB B-repeat-containing protein, partial [Treponema sp.]|nr:InlB B-repeat-containing protein [Treponema sp.]
MKKIFLLIAAFCAMSYFAACSDLLGEPKNHVAIATENGNELSSGEAMLSFSLDAKNDISCSALPNISADFFSPIIIYYRPVDGTEDIEIGTWNSNGALKVASVPFKTGTWIFSVLAVCETGYYYTEETKTIKAGKNSLLFTLIPMMMQELEARHGYGSLYVSAAFPVDNLKLVTGGLYTMDEEAVPGFADETLQVSQRGTTYYEKDDIPAGDYILIFKFFADTEKKILLGTYREFAGIFALARSESKVVLQSLSNLYSISYETNGGAFAEGYSPCLSYTRHSQSLSLPDKTQITKAGSDFGGWYEDENFEGPVVDFIPSGSVGNKKFYAKWLDKWTVTFLPNGGSFADGSKIKTQQITKGASENLVTANDLGLTNNGRNFLGWITSITNVSADYADGASIAPDKNIVLMALWAQGNVSRGDDGKTKDSDGDGVSDYDELYKFFTDPANKDTDGDGWTDGQELVYYTEGANTFNPRIADVPQLEIQFVGRPEIGFNYQTSSTDTVTESLTNTEGTVHSQSATNTNSHTRNLTNGWHAKAGFGFEWSAGAEGALGFFGAKAKNTFNFEAGYNGSVMSGDTFTYSQNQSESFSQSVTKGHTTSETTGKTVTGGTIRVNAKFKNPSNLAYTVRSATVTFTGISDFRQPNGYPTPVASVDIPNVGTIPPGGETGTMVIKYGNLGVAQTEELLKWSSGLNMSITNYTITLQKEGAVNANDFTGALTTVNAMTACLTIDYGPSAKHKAETHHVATKYLYNPEAVDINGLYKKVTIKDLLEIAGISESKGNLVLGNGGRIKRIRDYNYQGYQYGAWYVQHTYTRNNLSTSDTYNYYSDIEQGTEVDISKIYVQAGDLINIFYSLDKDKDGVPYNEELICGTSDDKPDTDGDGLTDGEELYGWKPATKTRSIPEGSETQQHIKITDPEKKIITNPNNPDTDGDGYNDLVDPDPIEPKLKNITSLRVTQYKTSADENAKFKDFKFESAQYLEDIYESLYLNLVPTMPGETIEYKLAENGDYKKDFSSAKEFKLDLGQNKIWIKVTAVDGFTTKESVLTFESRLRPLENLQLKSPDGKGNTMTLSYNAYTDRRVVADDKTAGLLLHFVRDKNCPYDRSPDLGLANPNDLPDFMSYVSTAKDRNGISEDDYDFWTKVSVADLKAGTTTISGLKSQTLYSIDSIMYYESGAKYARVSKVPEIWWWWVHGKTGKSQKATLTFWMHYLKAEEDEDGGCDPQYYWSIESTEEFLKNLSTEC